MGESYVWENDLFGNSSEHGECHRQAVESVPFVAIGTDLAQDEDGLQNVADVVDAGGPDLQARGHFLDGEDPSLPRADQQGKVGQ